ncbi:MAG: radical SAM protein [Clostridia bacterium]|nr:radical SAM protein [Clostridia bacterium]
MDERILTTHTQDEWDILLQNCKLCPTECGANRLTSVGACGVSGLHVAKYYLHPFEEPCISFKNGSGTIFFTGCNLRCAFCQNYELSRAQRGKAITPKELADVFRALEDQGAENISLVTPSHLIPYLVRAFQEYRPKIPVVYNTGSYEKIDALERIDEYVDIYLPDLKFYSPALAKRYLGKENYFDVASKAIAFMSQKPLRMTADGKMLSGTLVRHLVMPLCVSDSKAILKWIKSALPKHVYVSLMRQYTPFGGIENFPELSRPITSREYNAVVDTALELGLERLFTQEKSASDTQYIPKWDY